MSEPTLAATQRDTLTRAAGRRIFLSRGIRRQTLIAWLFIAPALAFYSVFVLWPLALSLWYSFFRWDGIGPMTWKGLDNYVRVLTDPRLSGTIVNAFQLILYFSFLPVALALVVASLIRRIATGRLGAASRTVLFLPQVIPLVAAGIVWKWVLAQSGVVNQLLEAVGLGSVTTAWLGDFGTALPAVGVIGAWVLLGLCTVLLLTGMTKIDQALYESARIDGASAVQEFFAITVPSLRNEIAVCLTVTIIAALATFDIVYVSTGGGPGFATMVPGLQIYILAFNARSVGQASALAISLVLLVLLFVLPLQRLSRESDE
jgi:raffinose/stachyose/melibiose transport system permease protein